MLNLKTITRRRFMTGIFSAGTIGCLSQGTSYGNSAIFVNESTERIQALTNVIEELYREHDSRMDEREKANMSYAFSKIEPSNHLEEAIAVACGVSCMTELGVVDDYVKRKNGEAPQLPDHPVFALKAWAVPDTRRLLIFREQVEALLGELTGTSLREGRALCKKLLKPGIEKHELSAMLRDTYREMNPRDIGMICDAALFYAPYTISYQWCSTIIDRAHTLLSKS